MTDPGAAYRGNVLDPHVGVLELRRVVRGEIILELEEEVFVTEVLDEVLVTDSELEDELVFVADSDEDVLVTERLLLLLVLVTDSEDEEDFVTLTEDEVLVTEALLLEEDELGSSPKVPKFKAHIPKLPPTVCPNPPSPSSKPSNSI